MSSKQGRGDCLPGPDRWSPGHFTSQRKDDIGEGTPGGPIPACCHQLGSSDLCGPHAGQTPLIHPGPWRPVSMPTSLLRPIRNTGECPTQRPADCSSRQDRRDPWSGSHKTTNQQALSRHVAHSRPFINLCKPRTSNTALSLPWWQPRPTSPAHSALQPGPLLVHTGCQHLSPLPCFQHPLPTWSTRSSPASRR